MIRTIIWSDCKEALIDQASRKLYFPCFKTVENFVDFFNYLKLVSKERICNFLKEEILHPSYVDQSNVIGLENMCLFMGDIASSIDIVLDRLNTLNRDSMLDSLWCYIDCEKKAIVHFVRNDGWYAEIYFSCEKDFSALHFIYDDNQAEFIPVIFSTDISKYLHNVDVNGGFFLHDYFPRDIANFIPKKSFKKKSPVNVDVSKPTNLYDKGDNL